jgi:hypothetical protein
MGTKIYGHIYGRKGWDALKSGNVWHDAAVSSVGDDYGLLTVNANSTGIITEDNPMQVTGGASSVIAEYTSPSDFSASYTSSSTITISGVPITISDSSQIVYIKKIPISGDAEIYVNGSGDTLTYSSGVITISDETPFASGDVYEVGINGQKKAYDPSTQSDKVSTLNNVWNQYTDSEVLVTAQDLTASYADFGAEIDMRGFTHLRVGIVLDVNDSEGITLKLLGLDESGGSDEYEIEGGTTQAIAHTADNKFSYEFDVKGNPFIQLQAVAETVGSTAGDLTITISKIWKGA